MAIAFVAAGTAVKTGGSSSPVSVPLPAGHASGHGLLLFTLTDDNTGTTSNPSGWVKLTELTAGATGGFLVYTRMEIFYRVDTGSLGADVSVSFSSAAWPTGDASVFCQTLAYSGLDPAALIETWDFRSFTDTTAAQLHPQMTSTTNGDWLMSVRSAYSNAARTFTASGGTNSERIDDNFTNLHLAVYDSNSALSPGLQTQRTTTASGTCSGGGSVVSILLKAAPAAGSATANPTTAEATGTAFDPAVTVSQNGWGLCTPDAPVYSFKIDWDGSGAFAGNVTSDALSDISMNHGRDQERQLNPAAVGAAAFDLINVDRTYSPENAAGPLFGELDPARKVRFQVDWAGVTYPLFNGRIDDFDVKADRSDRTVSFTFLDGLSELQGTNLSTSVYTSQRTGYLIGLILDAVGWTGPRDLDPGATVVPYWWEEGTDALEAVSKLVRSEGPPAIAYAAPDGTFVFRDRHHRLLRTESTDVQAVFGAGAVGCASPAVTGHDYTPPFTYSNGWRDIVNVVSFDVPERSPDASLSDAWTSDTTLSLSIGQSAVIDVSTSDPFRDAVVPVAGTDYTLTGAGTALVTLSRTQGQSVKITILAVGGSIVVSDLKLRARLIPVRRTVKVSQRDAASVTSHGERAYPKDAPWANAQDAYAIANMVLLHYSVRRPTVQMRVVSQDPEHLAQILQRALSDRIHIRNDELGLDSDFFIEKIAHTVERINQVNRPPVHAVVFGCEKDLERFANPFTFDLRGAGFDDGVFDPFKFDDPDTVFIFDDPDSGRFNFGQFGT